MHCSILHSESSLIEVCLPSAFNSPHAEVGMAELYHGSYSLNLLRGSITYTLPFDCLRCFAHDDCPRAEIENRLGNEAQLAS